MSHRVKYNLGEVTQTATKPEQKLFWFYILLLGNVIGLFFCLDSFILLKALKGIRLKPSLLKQLLHSLILEKLLTFLDLEATSQKTDEHSCNTNHKMKSKCNICHSVAELPGIRGRDPCKTQYLTFQE